MATPTRLQAESQHARQASIAALCVQVARELFRRTPDLIPARVATFQYAAATTSVQWVAGLVDDAPVTNAAAFAGWTSEGLELQAALAPLVDELQAQIHADAAVELYRLDRAVASQVADAGRSASQVEFSTRPDWTNYVRMISPPCCARCAVLAGRIYRDLEAFQRHPGCDCQMIPVSDWQAAHDAGLVSSFRAAFDRGDVTGLSKADSRAIREGAAASRVVGAHKGLMTVEGMKVTTSMTGRTGKYRLRPEAIYKMAGDDFAKRLDLLMRHGYMARKVDPSAFVGEHAPKPMALPHRPAQQRPAADIFAALEAAGAKPSAPLSP